MRGMRAALRGGWTVEAIIDYRCILLGVNWSAGVIQGCYLHLGPIIVGVVRRQ